MAIIGLYDADMIKYTHVLFNLDLMKLSTYYKNKNHIVQLIPNIDFDKYRGECEFRDCTHIKEDHCAIKMHVQNGDILKSRYENYLKFVRGEEWQYHVHTYQVMIKKE